MMGIVVDIFTRKVLSEEDIEERIEYEMADTFYVEPIFTDNAKKLGIKPEDISKTINLVLNSGDELGIEDYRTYFNGNVFDSFNDYKNMKDPKTKDNTPDNIKIYSTIFEDDVHYIEVDSKYAEDYEFYYRILRGKELEIFICIDAVRV